MPQAAARIAASETGQPVFVRAGWRNRQPFVCDGPETRTLNEEPARIDEEDVSAQEARAEARARLHGPHGFEGRSACARSSSGQGAQAAERLTVETGLRRRARAADAPAPRGLRGHRTTRPGPRDTIARASLDADGSSGVADRALDPTDARWLRSAESGASPAEGAGQGATGAHRSRMGSAPDRQAGRRGGEPCRAGSRDRRAPGSVARSVDEDHRAGIDRRVPAAHGVDAAELSVLADVLGVHLPGHRALRAPQGLLDGCEAHRPMQPIPSRRLRPGPMIEKRAART